MTAADRLAKVEETLAHWTRGGEVVAKRTDTIHAEKTIVTKRGDRYCVTRGFTIGGEAHVSTDQQDVSADEVITFLLGGDDA